jgi:DNA-binding response OmpR family regulator
MTAESDELSGKRIIVVEDDNVLANEICRDLRDLGAIVLGPAPTPFYATQLIGKRRIDAAVLDVHLHGETVFGVADMLQDQGAPLLFLAANDPAVIPKRFGHSSFFEKPVDRAELVAEVVSMTRRPAFRRNDAAHLTANAEPPRSTAEIFALALARTLPSS